MIVREGGVEVESLPTSERFSGPESLLADEIGSFRKHGCAG